MKYTRLMDSFSFRQNGTYLTEFSSGFLQVCIIISSVGLGYLHDDVATSLTFFGLVPRARTWF